MIGKRLRSYLFQKKHERAGRRLGTRRIDFVICGTQKGGTSALDHHLRTHPAICMADRKEVHYFDTEGQFSPRPNYYFYHSFFSPSPSHVRLGEATPIYMYWYAAPQRIWQYNPNIKLIVSLRNPIDRAFSHWNMARIRKKENLSFWDAITTESDRCREALPYQHRTYSYIDRGHYLDQLRRLWSYFPQSQVLVVKQEDLRFRTQETLDRVCDFIDVPPLESVSHQDVHSRPYGTMISKAERDFLRPIFEPGIYGLERALGWDCGDWLSDGGK